MSTKHPNSRTSQVSRRFSFRKDSLLLMGLSLLLTACGGGSFDTGEPIDRIFILGDTNIQQINDYFVSTQGSDTLTCAELGCHGTDPETGVGTIGGGGFKFFNKLWGELSTEQQTEQRLRFETRVDEDDKPQSAILLRATQLSHSGNVNGAGGTPRYAPGDQIYLWIEEWLASTPPEPEL